MANDIASNMSRKLHSFPKENCIAALLTSEQHMTTSMETSSHPQETVFQTDPNEYLDLLNKSYRSTKSNMSGEAPMRNHSKRHQEYDKENNETYMKTVPCAYTNRHR